MREIEPFKVGDIIRLKDVNKFTNSRLLNKDVNAFEILVIEDDYIKLTFHEDLIPSNEILPIPINGVDDIRIYFDPIIAAGTYFHNQNAKPHITDYSYYMEHFKRFFIQNKNNYLYDIIIKKGFKFVHEIQHYMREEQHGKALKIHA